MDPILIEQVLVNLLKNAIDSMRDSYPRSRRGKAPPILLIADLDTNHQQPMLRIRIMDRGKGIDEEIITHIYDPFFSTKEEGMGMGLNICRSIIESHEGRLWGANNLTSLIENPYPDEGDTQLKGCTFTILLPLEHYLIPIAKNEETSG